VPCPIRKIASPNTACATGLTALIQGSRWILDGAVDEVLVAATESCFDPVLLAGYQQLGVFCDENGMRPFHPNRSGFALGEAAAALHLADGEYAQSRGLEARATIEGWGETADAHHMTQMDKEGRALRRALNRALEQANQKSEKVDLLHAHLTTTETNDVTERTLLEDWSGQPLLQAIKPSLGHTIGAAGLLEAIATVDVLRKGKPFPLPTARPEDVPDAIEWPDPSKSVDAETGATWNMGFGGHNAALLLRSQA
jgi:3-oxoacyl-[acyl-carrier-protein] synthase II